VKYFHPGIDYPLFQTDMAKSDHEFAGITAFPEVAREYALQGAELIAIATNWEKPYEDDWDLNYSSQSLRHTIFVAAANRIGFDTTLGFFGEAKSWASRSVY